MTLTRAWPDLSPWADKRAYNVPYIKVISLVVSTPGAGVPRRKLRHPLFFCAL